MSTYPIEKILADYANGRIDVEMALGHSLQHLSRLAIAQTSAEAERQLLRQKVNTLEEWLQTLQTKSDRVQTLPEKLTAMQHALTLLQRQVDSLITRVTWSPQPSEQG